MNTAAFLSRWSRRKRRATALVESTNARGRSGPSPLDGDATNHHESRARDAGGDVEATGSACAQTVPTSDLPDLVPLEAIGPETDIRAFLAAGVPSELTRAALRRAWLSDPKIRDFVGLADYDWDFNTQGSMAGFGMLEASDQIERELARLVRGAAAVTASEAPVSPAPIGGLQTGDEHHSTPSCEPSAFARLDDESAGEESTASDLRPEALADQPFLRQRKHGRALPK
jgi:uncharacterized protein DUF3306